MTGALPLSLPFPKGVAFDWDGTLLITRAAANEALEHVSAEYGREPWAVAKSKYWDALKSLKENFPNFFGNDAAGAYAGYLKYYREVSSCRATLPPHARAFVMRLAEEGVILAIVSNKEKSLLLEEVARFYPDIPFRAVLGNGDAPRNKPAADPLLAAFEGCGFPVTPETVWMVGDGAPDIACAQAAGCLPVLIGQGTYIGPEEMEKLLTGPNPPAVFGDFEELRRALR